MRGTQFAAEPRSTRRAGIESIVPETLQGINVADRLSQAGDRYSELNFTGHPPLTPVLLRKPRSSKRGFLVLGLYFQPLFQPRSQHLSTHKSDLCPQRQFFRAEIIAA
jgi:hypothetical protein